LSHERPLFAWCYRQLADHLDTRATGTHRDALVAGLSGRVVEIGAGTGLTFRRYAPPVRHVDAVEPEPTLREAALSAARRASVPVAVTDGVAEDLPYPEASADAAVTSLVLCSVADAARAVAELARVVRPGGELRLYEHVRAPTPLLARTQRMLDPCWSRLAGGCHMGRDPVALLAPAGFRLTSLERFRVPEEGPTLPPSPHILARAVRE